MNIFVKSGIIAGIAVALIAGISYAATTVVTPTNPDGWAEDSTPPADVQFVNGPGTPPMGVGSAQFSVDASGATDAELRNATYDGLKLSDITTLSYATYVQNNNNEQAPYLILNVDYNNDGAFDDLLFFEPVYQDASFCPSNPQGNVVLNTWQTWDALNGCWYSINGTAGTGPGINVKPLADIIAAQPNAAIAVSTDPKGAVRIVAGFGGPADWGNFLGNVDAFVINNDTYDFELVDPVTPTPSIRTPSSKDACKNGGWQTLTDNNGKAFKNQGDCVSYVATGGKNTASPKN